MAIIIKHLPKKVYFKNAKGQKLVGILHLPAKSTNKAILICHGFTGSKDEKQLLAVANALQNIGFCVLRFDFTGNGKSEGEFYEGTISQEISDVYSAIDFLKAKGFDKIGIIGHSLGGNISLLATKKFKFECIAILASGFNLSALSQYFHFEKVKFKNNRANVIIWGSSKVISKEFVKDFENKDITAILNALKTPLLIVHGDKDTDVNSKTAFTVYADANQPKEISIIKGADHLFGGKEAELANVISKFIKRFMK